MNAPSLNSQKAVGLTALSSRGYAGVDGIKFSRNTTESMRQLLQVPSSKRNGKKGTSNSIAKRGEMKSVQDFLQALQNTELKWIATLSDPTFFDTVFEGEHVQIRMNDFPDEPIYTVFFRGEEIDMEESPRKWRLQHGTKSLPCTFPAERPAPPFQGW